MLRGGTEEVIEARDLVPGDVLLLAAGDAVGADARLLEAAALEAAEAALTGESLPVAKHPGAAAARTHRSPTAATWSIPARTSPPDAGARSSSPPALDTEVGKIASLTESAEEPKTPLEVRHRAIWPLAASARRRCCSSIVVGIGMLRGLPFTEILMVAISQMVSMVPEGLPVAMTIALAVGMQRMAARGAIVRRLAAVETLGSTTVICTDKTGTLTRNEMTVTALWLPDGREIEVTGAGYAPEGKVLAE